MGEIRRGSAAIQEAAESKGQGGSRRPFIPSKYWKEDKEERYVLILNPIDDIPLFDMVQFIKTPDGFFQETVAKTDAFFGEKSDAFVNKWDATARKTNIAVAVELEPLIEEVNGRMKPRGFEVKTVEFERRLFDDDGEATGETEEVVAPDIGIISQSPNNFFNVLSNYDATEGPIHETPLKITRIGKDTNTAYTVVGYDDQQVDLTNLIEYVNGISYLHEEMDELTEAIGEADDDKAAALLIGTAVLSKRIDELVDEERYDELLEGVTESMDIYGNKKKKGAKKAEPGKVRTAAKRADSKDEEPKAEKKAAKAAKGDDLGPAEKMEALKKKMAEKNAAKSAA